MLLVLEDIASRYAHPKDIPITIIQEDVCAVLTAYRDQAKTVVYQSQDQEIEIAYWNELLTTFQHGDDTELTHAALIRQAIELSEDRDYTNRKHGKGLLRLCEAIITH